MNNLQQACGGFFLCVASLTKKIQKRKLSYFLLIPQKILT